MTNPMRIEVSRVASPDRLRDLLNLFGEVFDERDTYCRQQPDDAYLQSLLSGDAFVALGAWIEGDLAGALAAYELKKFEQARSEIYIYDLAVREAFRRRGVATALIDGIRKVARERDAWVVFVQADYVDEPAVALYSKLGQREDVLHFDIALDGEDRSG